MIRVWGGGIFEKDALYSACDEAGILVTQDFLMACGTYPEKEDWFISELGKEAAHAAVRLRNHPSLAWWSGDNENATRGSDTLADHVGRDSAMRGIEPVIRALDPARRFFRSSPYGGDKYMSQTAGTTHTTNFFTPIFKYLMGEDNSGYKEFYNLLAARFIAEEPTYGLPETSSLLRFMTKEDVLDDEEKILRFHSKTNPHCPITLYDYVRGFAKNLLGDFIDAEDRLFKYRYIQYEWIRVIFENCRRYIGYCDGLVFWMLNDCWPASMGWAITDYYNRPKASYYSFRRCAKSIIGSVVAEDGKYKFFISSDGSASEALKINVKAFDLETKSMVSTYLDECNISGYAAKEISLPFEVSDKLLIVADIVAESGMSDRCFYKSGKLLLRPCDGVLIKARDEKSVTLVAKEYVHAVSLEGDCVFSDNYFSLLKGEERTVYIDGNSDVSVKAYTLV